MNTILWIAIIIGGALILIRGLIIIAFSGMGDFFAPNKEIDSISEIKQCLGLDFGDGYKIIEHNSRNNHGDRPLNVSIELSDKLFYEVKEFVEKNDCDVKESLSEDKKNRYVERFVKRQNCFVKDYEASHVSSAGSGYVFFSARLTIDYREKTLRYSQTHM
jgi:hypothetical protein